MIKTQVLSGGFSADFIDNITYPVHLLRAPLGAMIKKGVILKNEQSLKVIKLNDNQIKILPGSAVFSDGGVMRIDDEGVTLPIEGSGVFYVYLQNGFVHGDVCPVISKTEPDDNAILLAKIDNDSIADMRKSAVLKIWEA